MNNPLAGTDPTGYSIEIVIRCGGSNPACDGHIPAGPKDSTGGSGSVGKSPESGILVNNGASSAVQRPGQSSMDIGKLQNTNHQNQVLTSQQKRQVYSDTLSTIGSGAKAAIGNLIPDTVNGIAGWTEQFLHKGEGSLGRLDQWIGVENEIVQEVANDLRKVGAVATANIPLMRVGVSTPNSPIASSGGVIRQFEQVGDKVYYRVFSGDSQMGGWLTAVPPRSSAWAREALALPRNNRASMIQEVLVPHGTLLERSRAIPMPEWGRMRGGAEQFRLIDEIPRQNFGPGVPFK